MPALTLIALALATALLLVLIALRGERHARRSARSNSDSTALYLWSDGGSSDCSPGDAGCGGGDGGGGGGD